MAAASSSSSSAGYALAATAMALSGTLVLFSICRANKPNPDCRAEAPPRLRPCLSSSEKREGARRGSKRRVRFADDVLDSAARSDSEASFGSVAAQLRMPANREALYRGMLRGRSMLRAARSY